jgi:4-hydroxybenzoate polyprenyltransferase
MLLAIAIVLLIIAIAGGVIIHPILFVLAIAAIAAIAVYFADRRRLTR